MQVRYEVAAGVATLTLDSPANRNALSRALMGELREALTTAQSDAAVRVVVLSHTGRVFCSGMDLAEARGGDASGQGVNALPALLGALWTSPTPVIARVGGPARAGGVGLLAACDVALTVRSASFAFSEVRLGLVPAVLSAVVLPRVDRRSAHELFLTGEVFDASRALRMGLVSGVCEDVDGLDAEVSRYAGMLALGAPGALARTKELLLADLPAPADRFPDLVELSARRFASAEGQEGIAAFAARRAPSWVPG